MTDRRVALVSGASRGLGAAIAERLARTALRGRQLLGQRGRGARVVAASSRRRSGRGVRADATTSPGSPVGGRGDTGTLGQVDVLVVNATGRSRRSRCRPDVGRRARPARLLCQESAAAHAGRRPGMRGARWGRIVHIGSDATDRALPTLPAYVTAKSAQLGLAAVSARTLGQWGITVNTVAPGWIPVERHAGIGRGGTRGVRLPDPPGPHGCAGRHRGGCGVPGLG